MFLALDGLALDWSGGSSSATAGSAYHLLLSMWSDQWVTGSASASAGAGYHLLLALWSDQWVTGSASATASLSLSLSFSFSHSEDDDGGHGHHHHGHGHNKWFDHHYRMADDEYWAAREAMFRRHIPLAPRLPADKPAEVVELVKKHDRMRLQADEIFNLPDLSVLSRELDKLSTQILNIELQSEDEALMVLLLS